MDQFPVLLMFMVVVVITIIGVSILVRSRRDRHVVGMPTALQPVTDPLGAIGSS